MDRKVKRSRTKKVDKVYHATEEELRALDEAEKSGVASEREVEEAFRSFRSER